MKDKGDDLVMTSGGNCDSSSVAWLGKITLCEFTHNTWGLYNYFTMELKQIGSGYGGKILPNAIF